MICVSEITLAPVVGLSLSFWVRYLSFRYCPQDWERRADIRSGGPWVRAPMDLLLSDLRSISATVLLWIIYSIW